MSSYNKAILMGNLTRDPETRQTQSGTAVTNAAIAVNESWADASGQKQEYTSFIDLTIFGKSGENFARYLKKGSAVLVEGRLKQERWQDKEGGNRSRVSVTVERWSFTRASNTESAPSQREQSQGFGGEGSPPPF